ncbi:MAG TPA: Hsp20/alpha crystallin family protein [Deltaproteobacteria bacterium]|nr:Hsp20/alpha crystallin family protein [Deltaproteobacteria bacterium]
MTMKYMAPWRWGNRGVPISRETQVSPIDIFQKEMNRLFDDFFKGFGMKPFTEEMESLGGFSPQVDMTEDEKSVQVTAELPGMDEKDIEINLSRDTLTIKGEKKTESEKKDKEAYYMERSFGSFSRVLSMPSDVDPDKAEAVFNKGVLNITLPKVVSDKKAQKKIRIKSS